MLERTISTVAEESGKNRHTDKIHVLSGNMQTERHIDRQTYIYRDRQIDRQTGSQAARQLDIPIRRAELKYAFFG